MSRLIFVPQYPASMRYQSWWITEFPKQFKKYYDEVVILGDNYIKGIQEYLNHEADSIDKEMFSPIEVAIEFEIKQINEYMNMKLQPDDTLFLADISFPGIFCSVLYHKPCANMFAYSHAGPLNEGDYFAKQRDSKFSVESGHSKLFNKVFFGSRYAASLPKWENAKVVALPDVPKDLIYSSSARLDTKKYNIVSVCRPTPQKFDEEVEKQVSAVFGNIIRMTFNSWNLYSNFLANSKILFISSKADTFNYTILDAIRCNCIPVAPRRLCFPEILPDEYLYEDAGEACFIINKILNKVLDVPEIKCKDLVDNFYKNICETMKENDCIN